jgi:hypothetical protein
MFRSHNSFVQDDTAEIYIQVVQTAKFMLFLLLFFVCGYLIANSKSQVRSIFSGRVQE